MKPDNDLQKNLTAADMTAVITAHINAIITADSHCSRVVCSTVLFSTAASGASLQSRKTKYSLFAAGKLAGPGDV